MAGDRRKLKTIHGLDYAMRIVQATDETLGSTSGVASNTISRARSGKPILKSTATWIMETIRTQKFQYGKRGPKYIRKQKWEIIK